MQAVVAQNRIFIEIQPKRELHARPIEKRSEYERQYIPARVEERGVREQAETTVRMLRVIRISSADISSWRDVINRSWMRIWTVSSISPDSVYCIVSYATWRQIEEAVTWRIVFLTQPNGLFLTNYLILINRLLSSVEFNRLKIIL